MPICRCFVIDGTRNRLLEPPPLVTSIVVLSSGPSMGLPDKGVSDVSRGYEAMSRDEKRAKLAAEFQRILTYGSRWNEGLATGAVARDPATGWPGR